MYLLRAPRLLVAIFITVALAGCDLATTSSDDPDVVVQDAIIAREQGDYDKAITILERSFEAHPDHAGVRSELAITLLEREGVDLFDVERILNHFTNPTSGSWSVAAEQGATCDAATTPGASPFNPTAFRGFAELQAARPALRRVLELTRGVVPPSVRFLTLCSGPQGGELVYDRDGALTTMRSRGLSNRQINAVLSVHAVALIIEGYLELVVDHAQAVSWYQVPDGQGGSYIALCADDLEAFQRNAEGAVDNLGEAVVSLDLRSHNLGRPGLAEDLVANALAAYRDIEDDLRAYCADR